MTQTTYGYKLPASPDTGDTFYAALAFDIQRLNDHSHDGVNSAPLSSFSIAVPSASWVAAPIGGGLYRQKVTLPAGVSYDTCELWFKLSSGEYVFPTVERVDGSNFYVYTNKNTLAYTAFYR